jgi:hypothetical protein
MFTQHSSSRRRIALGIAVLFLLLVAVTWPRDDDGPAFDSRYFHSITGKISGALPDWSSSPKQETEDWSSLPGQQTE